MITISIELAKRLLEYISNHQDEGPVIANGWRSKKLEEDIKTLETILEHGE